jgi:two-component system, chemotaxis family, CheB/CheR fusion protein
VARQVTAVLPDHEAGHGTLVNEAPARADVTASSRVQRALDALPAATMIIDTTDTMLAWNPAAELMFDIPPAAAIARKFRDLDVSYRVEGLRARIEDVKTRHSPNKTENATFARGNGDTVHADISIVPLLEGHRLIGVLVFATEATEQARLKEEMTRVAEQHATAIEELQSTNEELQSTNEELETTVEELQAANTELATLNSELESRTSELNRLDAFHCGLLDSLDDGVAVLDHAGIVLAWNQAAERMWGLKADQVVNHQFFTLPLGEVTDRIRGAFDGVQTTGASMDVLAIPIGRSGWNQRQGALRLLPLRSPAGNLTGAVAVLAQGDGTPAGER